MKLSYSAAYREDIGNIAHVIGRDNPAAAKRMIKEIALNARCLVDYPLSGRMGRIRGTREKIIAGTPYIIVYTVDEGVFVMRVLHGVQQWPPDPVP